MESLENRKAELDQEFKDQSQHLLSELKNKLIYANYRMTDAEFKAFKTEARKTFDFNATPAEMEEAFKNYRV